MKATLYTTSSFDHRAPDGARSAGCVSLRLAEALGVVLGRISDCLSCVLDVPETPGVVGDPIVGAEPKVAWRADRTVNKVHKVSVREKRCEVTRLRWSVESVDRSDPEADGRQAEHVRVVPRDRLADRFADRVRTIGTYGNQGSKPRDCSRVEPLVSACHDRRIGVVSLVHPRDVIRACEDVAPHPLTPCGLEGRHGRRQVLLRYVRPPRAHVCVRGKVDHDIDPSERGLNSPQPPRVRAPNILIAAGRSIDSPERVDSTKTLPQSGAERACRSCYENLCHFSVTRRPAAGWLQLSLPRP